MRQLLREDQQTEQNKHEDLHHPGKAVVEIHDRPVIDDFGVAEHKSHHIDGQQPAAVKQGGRAIGQDSEPDGHDGIQPGGVQVDFIDQINSDPPHQETHDQSDCHFPDEGQHKTPNTRLRGFNPFDQGYGKKHRHRIIAARLRLQRRSQALIDIFTPQDREYRSRIR
ncbi:hypothetical protein D3C71_885880 [compost metagenome]